MVQIKWTKLAEEDLKEIHDYVSRDSVNYARIQLIPSAGASVSLVPPLLLIAEKCLNHRFAGLKDDTD